MRAARAATAKLAGKEEEVGLLELHTIAEARLKGWMDWAASRRSWQTPDTASAEVCSHTSSYYDEYCSSTYVTWQFKSLYVNEKLTCSGSYRLYGDGSHHIRSSRWALENL